MTRIQFIGIPFNTGTIDKPRSRAGKLMISSKYKGTSGGMHADRSLRIEYLKSRISEVKKNPNLDDKAIKICMMPEFFWQNKEGGYDANEESSCDSLFRLLRDEIAKDYENWIFIWGTVIFYREIIANTFEVKNCALVTEGGDPNKGNKKEIVLVKRHMSSIDAARAKVELISKDLRRLENSVSSTGSYKGARMGGKKDVELNHGHVIDTSRYEAETQDGLFFEINGLRFGLEVCLDHREKRILTNVVQRSSSLPQVILVPSAGMSIHKDGYTAVYKKYQGLPKSHKTFIFNVDGLSRNNNVELVEFDPSKNHCKEIKGYHEIKFTRINPDPNISHMVKINAKAKDIASILSQHSLYAGAANEAKGSKGPAYRHFISLLKTCTSHDELKRILVLLFAMTLVNRSYMGQRQKYTTSFKELLTIISEAANQYLSSLNEFNSVKSTLSTLKNKEIDKYINNNFYKTVGLEFELESLKAFLDYMRLLGFLDANNMEVGFSIDKKGVAIPVGNTLINRVIGHLRPYNINLPNDHLIPRERWPDIMVSTDIGFDDTSSVRRITSNHKTLLEARLKEYKDQYNLNKKDNEFNDEFQKFDKGIIYAAVEV